MSHEASRGEQTAASALVTLAREAADTDWRWRALDRILRWYRDRDHGRKRRSGNRLLVDCDVETPQPGEYMPSAEAARLLSMRVPTLERAARRECAAYEERFCPHPCAARRWVRVDWVERQLNGIARDA